MNLSTLKRYAPEARREFIQAVRERAALFGITEKHLPEISFSGDVALIDGQAMSRTVGQQCNKLCEKIRDAGYQNTMEQVAYTWFNRLVAIRYMELHDYLDHGYRVLSARTEGDELPEIMRYAEQLDLPGLDRARVVELKLDGNKDAELYREVLLGQCHALHRAMPFLFETIGEETELLLPENLLLSDSILRNLVRNSPEEEWKNVEVIGWLYQFYIAERKDQVMARKSAVPTDDIPAVTQLFTPHWIVRYLVENSLGRLWLLNRPGSRLREHMPYYIRPVESGECEVDSKTDSTHSPLPTSHLRISSPEEIRICDPACGSGHMLTYAFDLLYLIYAEEGYAPNEIPALILRHNLHGLEICPRAAQLAELALVFKAREKSRRFFQPEHLVRPRIIELRDLRFDEGELDAYFKAIEPDGNRQSAIGNPQFLKLLHQFEEAKNFGSLIQPCLTESEIKSIRFQIENQQSAIGNAQGQLFLRETHLKVLRVLEQAEALPQRYHIVVANPPYMGSGNFNPTLRAGLEGKYKITRTDLYAIFLERAIEFVVPDGFLGMITMQSWMFTSSYTELREKIVGKYRISSLVQLGARAFASIAGEVVSTAMFCVQAILPSTRKAIFVRLTDGDAVEKEASFHLASNRFKFSQPDFKRVPGSPMVYWVGLRLVELYEKLPPVGNLALFREGLHTADNGRFVRQWWEVQSGHFGRSETSYESIKASGARWIPYNKGGGCIRWYGNYEYVVAFDEDSRNAMAELKGHIRPSQSLYFKEGGTWSDIGSKGFGVKYYPSGFLFDAKGPVCVGANIEVLIAGLNSTPFSYLAELLMPTISYKCGTVKTIPFPANVDSARVETTSNAAIMLARADWDNFETSWDFLDHPLLRPGLKGATLEASWRNWEAHCAAAIRRMQELETENNRLFIAAYGLDGELSPEVPEEQITLARADATKDMAAFLSYAVGCMMGRYSLEKPGLVLANQGDTLADYVRIVESWKLEVESKGGADGSTELSGVDRLAKGDGSGGDGLSSVEAISQGGALCVNESGKASGGIGAVEYCGGAGAEFPGGIPELSVDRTGITSGSGDTDSDCTTSGLHSTGAGGSNYGNGLGNQTHDALFDEQAGLTSNSPLSTPHPITFPPDEDGILPLTELPWFDDDVTERVIEFMETTFGAETLEENLAFLADHLGPKKNETPRETLRRYLCDSFFKDHLQTYKKRPIYWLFSSGKEKAFQALVYLHRYNEGTLARMRTEYVVPLLGRLPRRIEDLTEEINAAGSTAQQTRLRKQKDKLGKQLDELRAFDEKLRHAADQRISIDLDDGVKVNYGKFGDLLADVKKITGEK